MITLNNENINSHILKYGAMNLFNSLENGATLVVCTKKDKLIGTSRLDFQTIADSCSASSSPILVVKPGKAAKSYLVTDDGKYTVELPVTLPGKARTRLQITLWKVDLYTSEDITISNFIFTMED